ncbi:hypothetical protein ACLIKD_06915 [Azonexus sp. IMCC34842]|uniref:hypothetical protein n=1 Tax=Azonexus sp. IMCC34842 TaxID=3420950 RepID=UPI003D0B6E06
MSPSGGFLEKYKIWYLDLPKLIRIALLPAFVAILANVLQLVSIEQPWKGIGTVILVLMLLVVAYNQLIEADTLEEYKELSNEKEDEIWFWRKMYGDTSFLNKLYSELVLRKSEMWRDATERAAQDGVEVAKKFVRDANSLKANIDRIIALVYKAFERHMDVVKKEEVRVAYFVPSEDSSRLVLKSWCNGEFRSPHSITNHVDGFLRGGRTLAVFVWTRLGQDQFFFIDDVPKYVAEHGDTGVFVYLSNGQASTVKSIFCYRIIDGLNGNCLGVISVDSNTEDMFVGKITEDVSKDILVSAGNRIIYETRFSVMKDSLGPYKKEA